MFARLGGRRGWKAIGPGGKISYLVFGSVLGGERRAGRCRYATNL